MGQGNDISQFVAAADPLYHSVGTFFFTGALLNIVLMLLNLLPVPPLDGRSRSRVKAAYRR